MKIRLTTIRSILVGLILLVIGLGVGYYHGTGKVSATVGKVVPKVVVNTEVPEDQKEVDFSLFWEVWRKLESEYVDVEKIDREEMVYGAIKGMVSALGDPYTVFLPPAEQKRTEEELSGAFEGVGIQLGYVESQLAVIAPIKGMPAEAAGVKAGDYILKIKDDNKGIDLETVGMSLPDAVGYIRGERGQKVALTMFRENHNDNKPFEVELTREQIVIPSVELEFITDQDSGKKVAHLALLRFGGRTEDEWSEAVTKILAEGDVAGVVLDMRNNPGGYLNGAIFIASEFIDSGVVVKQQGRYAPETFSVNRRGRLTDMKVDVLINKGSASASEIVAGALRDRKEATLVGERSFGKGTVQNSEELENGTGIHITVAKWLLPAGEWIHEDGIPPTVEVSDDPATEDVDEVLQAGIREVVGQ